MKNECSLAVCMPVYNAEKHIHKSIESILNQSYRNFIFIIADDCSTDRTIEVIKKFNDKRIKIIQNTENIGVVQTRNKLLDYCFDQLFDYMAIMDADDIAYPDRLTKQITILESDSTIAVCGTSMRTELSNNIWYGHKDSEKIKVDCIFRNPIPTASAIIRLNIFKLYNLRWNKSYVPCADYYLWYLMLFKFNLKARNTGDIDMYYTFSPSGVSHGNGIIKQELKDAEVKKEILKKFSIEISDEHAVKFMKVALSRSDDPDDAQVFLDISKKLKINNKKLSLVDQDELNVSISRKAVSYLSKTKNIPCKIKKEIVNNLILPNDLIFIYIEKYLMKFKKIILDKYFPNYSIKLFSLFLAIRK